MAIFIACWTSISPAGAKPRPGAHTASYQYHCADPYPATRDPSNPLMLTAPPGSNPLNGAQFVVDGPTHGAAAGAIATLMNEAGVGPPQTAYANTDTFAQLAGFVQGVLTALGASSSAAHDIQLLEKVASEPVGNRISSYSMGGGPGATHNEAMKLFCNNYLADAGSIPILTTYFLHGDLHNCATNATIEADRPTFERHVNELASAIENRPVVLLLEFDAIGTSQCMSKLGSLGQWLTDLRYEVDKMASLPHAVVYVEVGYADGDHATYAAGALNKVDIGRIQGFFTNDTHSDWTSNEVTWAEQVSRMTHGAHFIVNTATNGQGPLVPKDRVHHGNEVLCNAPGRGLGPRPTTNTGFANADAFLWMFPPGNSSGPCNGGPPAGTFWVQKAEMLAANADGRLGPNDPSQPY